MAQGSRRTPAQQEGGGQVDIRCNVTGHSYCSCVCVCVRVCTYVCVCVPLTHQHGCEVQCTLRHLQERADEGGSHVYGHDELLQGVTPNDGMAEEVLLDTPLSTHNTQQNAAETYVHAYT